MEDAQQQNINNQNEENIWKKQQLEREEYLTKLKKWLDDARLWHYNTAGFSYTNGNINGFLQQQFTTIYPNVIQPPNLRNVNVHVIRRRIPRNNPYINRNAASPFYRTPNRANQFNVPPRTYEFVIPPLWKRMVAEFMDFLILFLLKMMLTFLVLESFNIIDLKFYGIEAFQKNLENTETAMPLALELLTLELLHRFIVCAYETYFLRGKFCATPGKRYMGLIVVTAENISPVPGRASETISATAAATLGWQKSLIRSALKNLFVGLFLPLCIAFYIFPHNRTSYDMMSNSVVVEYNQEFMVYNAAI